jgi:hypothetical protein
MDRHTNPIEHTSLQQLLDRLDPCPDEPCTVPGCSHTRNARLGAHDVVVGVRAA